MKCVKFAVPHSRIQFIGSHRHIAGNAAECGALVLAWVRREVFDPSMQMRCGTPGSLRCPITDAHRGVAGDVIGYGNIAWVRREVFDAPMRARRGASGSIRCVTAGSPRGIAGNATRGCVIAACRRWLGDAFRGAHTGSRAGLGCRGGRLLRFIGRTSMRQGAVASRRWELWRGRWRARAGLESLRKSSYPGFREL
jgi:hypothetical protein